VALQGFLFVLPALVLLGVFALYPVLSAVRYSFTRYDLLTPPVWIGLANYQELLRDHNFLHSLRITLIYVFAVSATILVLSLGLGLALASRIAVRGVFRAVFFLPWVTSLVSLALIWRLMYHAYGPWNDLLVRLGIQPIPWLISSRYALLAIVLFTIWRSVGYFAVMFLVGIQAISPDYFDSARLDGAGSWSLMRHIIWPLLKPTTVFVVIIVITSTLRHIDTFFLMTGGGPADSTRVLALLIYEEGFAFLQMGKASALSIYLFLGALAVSLVQLRMFRGEGHAV
jgi:multiple sugar transport system permease protein